MRSDSEERGSGFDNPGHTVAAVDVGATTIKGALFDRQLAVRRRHQIATPAAGQPEDLLCAITTMIEVLGRGARTAHPHGSAGSMVAVGVALPGLVDSPSGVVGFASNLGLRDMPIRDLLTQRVPVPVSVEHDGRAAGLGELRHGAARGHDDAVLIVIGTGIATAIICNGRVVRGARSRAGELGHVPVVPAGERCSCGMRGCMEAYAGGASIVAQYFQGTSTKASVEQVVAAALAGEHAAQTVLSQAVSALARGIVGYTVTMDPDLVLIGGGVSKAGRVLLDPLRELVSASLTWRTAPAIELTALGSESALYGAALIAWESVDHPSAPAALPATPMGAS